jgi:type IV secretory pathway VirB10-like protein
MKNNDLVAMANPHAKNPKYKRFLLVAGIFGGLAVACIVLASTNKSDEEVIQEEKTISTAQRKPPKINNEPQHNGIIQSSDVANMLNTPINKIANDMTSIPSSYRENSNIGEEGNETSEDKAIKSTSYISTPNHNKSLDANNMPDLDMLNKLVQANNPNIQTTENDPNLQNRKEKFLQTKSSSFYLDSQIEEARSKFEIKAGSFIPAMMTHGINSDLPGDLTAIVTENVYDSTTGQYLLIPQGTKINGVYDSQVAFGQKRVMTIWTRLIFPNGKTFNLGTMSGSDQGGYSGFQDKVNNNYARTFGSAILVAIIGSGMQLSQPKGKTNTGNDAQETITANVAQQTGNTAQGVLGKMLNVQPTLEIDAGYRFNIKVNKDMVLERD